MSSCYGCGASLSFRYIDGRCVPLGCRCYTGAGRSGYATRIVPTKPWLNGFGIVPWPVTFSTQCWWCGDIVFYHTNGYGDCVLLDELGPPWPVHHCWDEYGSRRRSAAVHTATALLGVGTLLVPFTTDLRPHLERSAWWRSRKQDAEAVISLKHVPFNAPPNPPIPGSSTYLIVTWVVGDDDRMISLRVEDKLETWHGLRTGMKDFVVFVPAAVRKLYRSGDPLIAEVSVISVGGAHRYVVLRARSREGARIDVYEENYPVSTV
jgi:hypothetical protein